ncbi:YdcF family protein [Terriglobus roseus]|uniref:Uncharacterized SAM-binding protein YcdF, DUF218 family n=1 Tax=Terriglobus roseus TaxID=392734 RepID=A0A1H4IUC2_9BACT|nr:YdcF family protein [Terriglobus roseus]SEB37435.1 Uncharacterized SAM-binding protein YcdF, DUF218 family [Terriglobus roseus]
MRFVRVVLWALLAAAVCSTLFVFLAWRTIPSRNSAQDHFDTLMVLGTPAKADGTPSAELRERIDEGVREYKAGVAPHIIMTGGAAHNKFVEGQVMADYAAAEGVPRDAIIVEGQAQDTIQNIWYSHAIMEKNGWHSAEVISSPYHLPRTSLILEHYTGPLRFDWRTHPAHWPATYNAWDKLKRDYREAVTCFAVRRAGFQHSNYLPAS